MPSDMRGTSWIFVNYRNERHSSFINWFWPNVNVPLSYWVIHFWKSSILFEPIHIHSCSHANTNTHTRTERKLCKNNIFEVAVVYVNPLVFFVK